MPSQLSHRKQLIFGGLMMLAWVAAGTPLLVAEEPSAPILLSALVGTCSFFLWFLTNGVGEKMWIRLGNVLPAGWEEFVGFSILGVFFAMWVAILLLPLFGDWRSKTRLLFSIQNVYAAIQALAYPLLTHFF